MSNYKMHQHTVKHSNVNVMHYNFTYNVGMLIQKTFDELHVLCVPYIQITFSETEVMSHIESSHHQSKRSVGM